MKLTRITVAAVAMALGLTIAGCSSDDGGNGGNGGDTTTTTTPSASTAANPRTDPSKLPTAKVLNQMLDEALDAKIPNKEKINLVQGSEKDPSIFTKLIKAQKENPDVKYRILNSIKPAGTGRATAKIEVTLPGRPKSTQDFQIVFDKGYWKLSKEPVCQLISFGDLSSPMCPKPAN